MKRHSIIVDIDGTLANCDHRLHHIKGETKDWDAFHREVYKDKPIWPAIHLVYALHRAGWFIILMTGRKERCRSATANWLSRNRVPYDMLLMREENDHRQDVEVKRELLHMLKKISLSDVYSPSMVIEDRKRVIDMWREEGLVALHCADGEY